jgi:hypothetical protein
LIVDQDPATHFKQLPKLKKMLVKDETVNIEDNNKEKEEEFEENKADRINEKERTEDDFVKSADFNKELYMREYGVQFAIPTSFVLNSHFFRSTKIYF